MKGKIQMPGVEASRSNCVATDGKHAYSIEEDEKTFTVGEMPGASMLLGGGSICFVREFLHDTPFSDEIDGDSQKYEGTKTVGDVDCEVIYVVYSEGAGEACWYFGNEDNWNGVASTADGEAGRVGRAVSWGPGGSRL